MGERDHDRQLREARARYLGAWRQAREAAHALTVAATPLDPDTDWSEQQWQALLDATAAFTRLVEVRREWDGLRRDPGSSH